MTARERIESYLAERTGQGYCDDCLSTTLSIKPRQQVQQKTSKLATDFRFVRSRGWCRGCRSDKMVISSRTDWVNLPGPKAVYSRHIVGDAPVKPTLAPLAQERLEGAKRIVLIPCASKKRPVPAKARDLYTSPLFQSGLSYAESLNPDAIFVLSAKHGLVPLDQQLSPYEETLNVKSDADIRRWAHGVLQQLSASADLERDEFVILAGERYRRHLTPHLRNYRIPMEGLRFGEQLSFLMQRVSHVGRV